MALGLPQNPASSYSNALAKVTRLLKYLLDINDTKAPIGEFTTGYERQALILFAYPAR